MEADFNFSKAHNGSGVFQNIQQPQAATQQSGSTLDGFYVESSILKGRISNVRPCRPITPKFSPHFKLKDSPMKTTTGQSLSGFIIEMPRPKFEGQRVSPRTGGAKGFYRLSDHRPVEGTFSIT